MGKLYKDDLYKYQNYFDEASKVLGIDVQYRYITKRKTEKSSGESVYSELSEPITQSVIVEKGLPLVDSLKQLGWFVNTEEEQILVDFPIDTPNLQEGCRFLFISNVNMNQNKEYVITKLSNTQLYPSCIKCLCMPVLETESTINKQNEIEYGQQEIISDNENYSFINEEPKFTMF